MIHDTVQLKNSYRYTKDTRELWNRKLGKEQVPGGVTGHPYKLSSLRGLIVPVTSSVDVLHILLQLKDLTRVHNYRVKACFCFS